jgi:hypothetical protein
MRPEENGHKHTNEHQGTFWVFAWPNLVTWDCKITWLISPTGAGSGLNADLYGISESGELLILEAKKNSNKVSNDPFKKLLGHKAPTPERLTDKWSRYLKHELEFLKRANEDPEKYLSLDYPPPNPLKNLKPCWPGVTEYSVCRMECRRYPIDYLKLIGQKIDTGEYEEICNKHLRLYEHTFAKYYDTSKLHPHYVGLFTLFGDHKARLRDRSHYDNLVASLGEHGEKHVHILEVRPPEHFNVPCDVHSYRLRLPVH